MTPAAPLITDTESARRLFADLVEAREEVAEALFLDPKWRLSARHRFLGNADSVALSVRALVGHGLSVDARYVVLGHNHPSGDPEPSARDFVFTRRLADALRLIDMPLADHIIVARGGTVSFRERGLL